MAHEEWPKPIFTSFSFALGIVPRRGVWQLTHVESHIYQVYQVLEKKVIESQSNRNKSNRIK